MPDDDRPDLDDADQLAALVNRIIRKLHPGTIAEQIDELISERWPGEPTGPTPED